jgi:tetratricopeptide (TPR) repeat protein
VAFLQATSRPFHAHDSPTEFGRDFDVLVQKVESFGGRIEEAGPARIVAAFGVDPAEDAPRRAALAAMAIQNALGRGRQTEAARAAVTIVIHAEQCPVAEVSGRHRVDTDAKARLTEVLEALAAGVEPSVIISGAARSLLGPRFLVDDLDETGGPSKRGGRLLAYHQDRFGLGGRPGPFVGRESELAVLRTRWGEAREGRGQIVAVIGEPGIGKSRLLFEFRRALGDEPLIYLEGRGESYGSSTPYLPVVDFLEAYFQLDERDASGRTEGKVTAQLLALDSALASDVSPFLVLLGAPAADREWQALEPGQRRQRTLDTLTRFILRLSQARPVLLVVEDLHWIDTETQAFLDRLVASLPAARLLVLVSYRPEYGHAWGNRSSYTQLRLDPLELASAELLVRSLVGDDAALQPLARLLVERTEGNPFFMEESVRMLIETRVLTGGPGRYQLTQPLQTIQVPATVQAVLAARIDRLSPEDKGLLQVASVVGKDVSLLLLQATAGLPEEALHRALGHLQAAELLHETRLFPEAEYTFKHALTHEVAYGRLPQERRRELHMRIVDVIETLHKERLGEHVERLAHHALRGEVWEKAVHYLSQAGSKAAGRSALQDARFWFEQALGVLGTLPETQSTLEQAFEIRVELRRALNLLGEVRLGLKRLHEAEVLAERLNDDHRRGLVCGLMANVHSLLGEFDEARAAGSRALEIANALGDLELRILSTSFLAQAHYYRGEYKRAVEFASENLAALPVEWIHKTFGTAMIPASVYDRSWLVMGLAQLGRFAETDECEAEAIRIAESTQHAATIGIANRAVATLHLVKGDWTGACAPIEHGIVTLRKARVILFLPDLVASSAFVLAHRGQASEAMARLAEAEELLERRAAEGIVGNRGWVYLSLGRTRLLLGRLDEARGTGERVVESSPRLPGIVAHALHLLAEVAMHPDRFDPERGEAHYRRTLALAEPRAMRPLVAHCHFGLGRLRRRVGEEQEALEYLTIALKMYREMGMTYWLEQAEAERVSLT